MRLRKLEAKDAPLMLEWMHDREAVKDLQADFAGKTLEDCERFIRLAAEPGEDLHLAAAEEPGDEYLGTVSLKHIRDGKAEFAIAVRRRAMGKGVAAEAMRRMLAYGTEQLGLEKIYWCVSPENRRAVRFYDRNGYVRTVPPEKAEGYTEEQKEGYIWYEYPSFP